MPSKNFTASRTQIANIAIIIAAMLVAGLSVIMQYGSVYTTASITAALVAALNAYLRWGTWQPIAGSPGEVKATEAALQSGAFGTPPAAPAESAPKVILPPPGGPGTP